MGATARDFRWFWAATTVSVFGSQVTGLALPLTAIQVLGAEPLQLGLLAAAATLPFLTVGLAVGAWVDRVRRRPVLIAADLGRAVALATIPLAFALGVLTIEQLLVVAFVVGVMDVFFDVAYDAFLPVLVPRDRLVQGNSRIETSRSSAQVLGPGIAGFLIGRLGAPLAIVVDAVSYLLSAAFAWRIRAVETPVTRDAGGVRGWRALVAEIGEGLRFVLGSVHLRHIAGTTGSFNFFTAMFFALYLLYMTRDLRLSPEIIGLVFAIGQLGLLAGVFVAGRAAHRLGIGPTIVTGSLLSGVGLLLIPLAPTDAPVPFLVAAQLLFGLALPIYNINQRSLRQAITPDRLLGRMTASMRFLVWGTMPVGALLGGILGTTLGVQQTLWIGAAGASLAFLSVLLSPVRGLRTAAQAVVGP